MTTTGGNKTPKRNRPNFFYAIMSVSLVLFILGFFGLFLLHAQKWVQVYKENVNVMVEVKDGVEKSAINDMIRQIERYHFIKNGSVEFVSKENVAEEMEDELGSDLIALDITNPYYDVVNFNLKAAYLNPDSISLVRNDIKENINVNDVYYQEGMIDQIHSNFNKIGIAALILGLFFVVIAVALIHNTIRLAMYSNRFLIKNMQLVGASWSFISRPYISKGIMNGLWSSLIAMMMLGGLLLVMHFQFPELHLDVWLNDIPKFSIVFGSLLLLGVLISGLSTYYVVSKYLKMRLDDLY